jgi:hypothetical protein
MKTTSIRLLALLAAVLPATGCVGTVIREAGGAMLGAKGTYMQIQPLAPDKETKTLGVYSRFELGTIADGIGGKTPPELFTDLERIFPEEVGSAHLPDNDTGKTLIIRGTIAHYESASTIGYVLGPMEEVICRTELVDKDTGRILGVANCIGRTNAASNSGVKSKASGLAKAFVKWIESGFPENGKTK